MTYTISFFWGIIAALGCLFFEFFIPETIRIFTFPKNNLVELLPVISVPFITFTAVLEESFKFLIIRKRIMKFFPDERILAGSLATGLGFAATEIALIFFQLKSEWTTNVSSLVEISILHIATCGLMGYLVLKTAFKKGRITVIVLAAALIHFLYNFSVISGGVIINYVKTALIFSLLVFIAGSASRIRCRLANP